MSLEPSVHDQPSPAHEQPLLISPAPVPPGTRTGCLGRIEQIVLFVAVIAISFGAQFWVWAGAILGGDVNAAAVTAIQAALLLFLLLPAAWFRRAVRERAIVHTWLAAALYPLALAGTRLLPPTESQLIHLLQLGITLLFLLGLRIVLRKQGQGGRGQDAPNSWSRGLALAGAAVFALPWVLRGALGSPVDTVLALLLGVAFGAVLAQLLQRIWLPSLFRDSRGRGSDIFTGGLIAGAAAVILSSGLSLNGLQLVLMTALPALGWLAVALAYAPGTSGQDADREVQALSAARAHREGFAGGFAGGFDWWPPALLVGGSAAVILALIDVSPLAVEAGDPALLFAWQGAAISIILAWILGLGAWLLRWRWGMPQRRGWAWAAAGALWAGALVLFALGGRWGFYGDRLFVILHSQADVAGAAQMADYDARRRFVHATLVAHADASQAELRSTLERFGLRYTPYYLVNAIEVDGGLVAQLLLAARPEVSRILPSPRLRPLPGGLDAGPGEAVLPANHAWNLTLLRAPQVWEEFEARGQGIVIGQSDSGVQADHPELADAYRGASSGSSDYTWFDPWSHTLAPVDYGGHGTHTLGSVLGNRTGVAPDATWIACANLQRNLGNPALYLDCLQFMLAPFPLGGDPFRAGDPLQSAHVLNNSWGCPQEHEGCDAQSLEPAVDVLRAAGIFVVASAGNDGPRCSTVTDPIAIYAGAFSVGAVDEGRNLAPFSSTGPVTVDSSGRLKPDIAAPGVDVWSAYPGSQYARLSGTSMAGPHVAGVVALLWSANPALIGDIERTEAILRETAQPFSGSMTPMGDLLTGEEGLPAATPDPAAATIDDASGGDACILQADPEQVPNNLVGYGIVDAYAAVQQALAVGQ